MRLLGATLSRSTLGPARLGTAPLVVTNNFCKCPERFVHGRGIGEHLCYVWFQHDDVAAGHASGVRVSPPTTKIIFGEDVIGVDAGAASNASLLHSSYVRDESLSERL